MRSSGIVTATLASSEPTPKAESSRSLANEVKAESGVRRYEKTTDGTRVPLCVLSD